MSYRSALVDRGQVLREQASARKVEGSRVFTTEEGPTFRVRLELNAAPKRKDGGRTATEPRPMLMTDRKDSEGHELRFRSSDRIQVTSRELGEALWEVDGDPKPIRKKKRLVGWELNIKRVNEPPVD